MRESVAKEKTINELLNRMCLFLIPNIYKFIVSKQYLNENRCPFQLFSSRVKYLLGFAFYVNIYGDDLDSKHIQISSIEPLDTHTNWLW